MFEYNTAARDSYWADDRELTIEHAYSVFQPQAIHIYNGYIAGCRPSALTNLKSLPIMLT